VKSNLNEGEGEVGWSRSTSEKYLGIRGLCQTRWNPKKFRRRELNKNSHIRAKSAHMVNLGERYPWVGQKREGAKKTCGNGKGRSQKL